MGGKTANQLPAVELEWCERNPKSTQSDSKSFALEEEEREVAANARGCQFMDVDVESPGEPLQQ